MGLLLPGMVDNWIIVGGVEDVPDRLGVEGRFGVEGAVVGHVVGRWGVIFLQLGDDRGLVVFRGFRGL